MKCLKIEEGKLALDKDGALCRQLYDSPEAAVFHIQVSPGGSVTPHITPVDMEFYVLEGRGIFILGEEKRELEAGVLLQSPRGVPHGMTNPGPGTLRVLAIKNPRP
jgi:quercetin dioxygenase-like cupin family protein